MRLQVRGPLVRSLFFLLAVGLALLYSGCGGGQMATVSEQITAADGGTVSIGDDIVVRIPPNALSDDATVTITRSSEENPAPDGFEGAQSVGEAFDIDLGGAKLSGRVTLEIAYDPALMPEDSPEDAVFLAFYDEEQKKWVPAYGTVDLDRHVVVIETDHLSWWNPFNWDLSELKAKIMRGLESLLELVGLPVAEIPQCDAAPAHMSLDFSDSLLACIKGADTEGQAVLKLVNNRAYATLVDLRPGVQLNDVSHGSLTDAGWKLLTEKLGGDVVYIPPAGEAEFTLQFEEAGEIILSSAPSDMTLAGDMLIAIVSALGMDPVDGLKCLFEIMTPERQGTPTIGDLFDVVKDCVGVALKGTAGIVWGAIKTLVTLGAAAGELLVQRTAELFGGDEGRVTVTYSPPQPTPTTFSDPFAFCADVGTADREWQWKDGRSPEPGPLFVDERWAGAPMPDQIRERLPDFYVAPPLDVGIVWRCFEGKVMWCPIWGHIWCGTADTSPEPYGEAAKSCPYSGWPIGQDPFILASVYAWDCQGGQVVMVGRKELSVDFRGFFKENWEELEP